MKVYQVGDIVKYRTFGDNIRTVRITQKCKDIKNGKPGFDGELVSNEYMPIGSSVWGYDSQIIDDYSPKCE